MFEALDPDADPQSEALRVELLNMILYGARNDARSMQLEIGPSEGGNLCDRRLVYRVAQVPPCNTETDPWPATVGTAIHAWLAETVDFWNKTHGTNWMTEQTINFPEFGGIGHGDLYKDGVVIDWKTSNSDLMKKYREVGPPPQYVTQVNLYGHGYRNMGLPVHRGALVFIPRSGWIKNMWVWSAEFNPTIATDAIVRLYEVAKMGVNLEVLQRPERFDEIPATPGDGCGICPWFNPRRDLVTGATDKGCPGPGY